MKQLFLGLAICICSFAIAQKKDYPITAVPFTQVTLQDTFWLPRIQTNHTITIPASFERCKTTGRIKNFEMAAARSGKFCTVYPFDDTDIYKTLEGASFSMSLIPDKKLDAYMDSLIEIVRKAQEPDGYLFTARTIDPLAGHNWIGKERWEKERQMSHELYNSGHLYEAAAAHYLATGKKNLLNIALKNADLVCSVFGPNKKHVAPGHEVVEMGLVKLYRITGKVEYLNTAKFFIEERGHYKGYDSLSKDPFKNGSYWQDHKPVAEQDEAIGHAVRAGYLYSAMADVAALTGDKAMLNAIDKIWNNVVEKKIYVQGGVGAVGDGERFGGNYELPNATAYNETCAAIANVYWNQRMFQLHGEAKYIDILEKSLYNGLLSGVGMDGKSFFYTNSMEIKSHFKHGDMEAERAGWFTCSCCPTNITRLIPSIPGYMYALKENNLYVNLFATSTSNLTINKQAVKVTQKNNYPWNGNLAIGINPEKPTYFNVRIRIPGWAQCQAMPSNLYTFTKTTVKKITIWINGQDTEYTMENGYAVIERTWKKGDMIRLQLPMTVQKIISNEKVVNNKNKMALQFGPLIYCLESPDNFGLTSNIIVPEQSKIWVEYKRSLLHGVMTLVGEGLAITIDPEKNTVSTKPQTFTAIPYYAWAHRGKGEMTIWIPQKVSGIELLSD